MEEAITALLAHVAGGRRHWVRAPQGEAKPFVVLNVVGGLTDYHMQGASGLEQSRLQADCYGATYGEAKLVARAVKTALSGRRQRPILAAFFDNERDLSEADAGEVDRPFRISLDFIVHHQQ